MARDAGAVEESAKATLAAVVRANSTTTYHSWPMPGFGLTRRPGCNSAT